MTWIAQCELGDANRWGELVELNRQHIADPNVIEPGWQLVLPQPGLGQCAAPPPTAASSSAASGQGEAASSERSKGSGAKGSGAKGSGGGLASIKGCESGGDYGAVSSGGQYRGAYQFDRQTWQSVGGTGDPAAASPAEQDQRASALHQQRGSSAWPTCG